MREKKIEQKLVTAVKKHWSRNAKHGIQFEVENFQEIIAPTKEGIIAFVEVKAPNQKPRPLQLSRHRLLRRLGFRVYVLDALEDIDKIIKEVMSNEAS